VLCDNYLLRYNVIVTIVSCCRYGGVSRSITEFSFRVVRGNLAKVEKTFSGPRPSSPNDVTEMYYRFRGATVRRLYYLLPFFSMAQPIPHGGEGNGAILVSEQVRRKHLHHGMSPLACPSGLKPNLLPITWSPSPQLLHDSRANHPKTLGPFPRAQFTTLDRYVGCHDALFRGGASH
jgi:hypothetical protein